jgi:GWxTD domain-containing protein
MPGKTSVGYLLACCLLGLFLPVAGWPAPPQQESASTPPAAAQTMSAKEKKKSERKLLKELDTPYRTWLEEDVVYIITSEEREVFLRLGTNEEREQFIEQFWQRRNPDPESPDNEFKEEHYRRIAYANARFASGLPGWMTDRGRIYIMWGPPDQIDAHPSGGPYGRTPDEGGGYTMAYPFEDWRYHYLEGVGSDITLEFVDPTMAGEYHLTMDPCEKDALAKVGLAGPTEMEAEGMTSKASRSMGADGTTCGPSMTGARMSTTEFDRLTQFGKVQALPPLKFKDLESLVTSRLLRDQLRFDYRFDFLRVTSDTVLVPITVQIANRELTFESHEGVNSAVLEVFGRVTTLTGRVVQTFEDSINRDFPESLHESVQGRSLYQKAVPLRPGLYRLDLVVKDVHAGNVGIVSTRLAVPHYDEDKLSTSTLILADQMMPVPSREIGLGPFVIGDTMVRPRVGQIFTRGERVRVYLQIYNLGVDEKKHRSDVSFEFVLSSVDGGAAKQVFRQKETSDKYAQSGQQMTLQKRIPLANLKPGQYKFTVHVTDNVSKQSISPTAEFTVEEAAASKN